MQVNTVTHNYDSISLKNTSAKKSNESLPSDAVIIGYYNKICARYPDISFRIEDCSNRVPGAINMGYKGSFHESGPEFGKSPDNVSIAIDITVLRKMYIDKAYEESICLGDIERIRKHWNDYSEPGYPYKCVTLEDTSGTIGTTYSQSPFSSEEEIRKINERDRFSLNAGDLYTKTQNEMFNKLLELGETKKKIYKYSTAKYKEYEFQQIYEEDE